VRIVRSEQGLPPFRELSPERLRAREAHLLDEIRLAARGRPSSRTAAFRGVRLAAAVVVAAAAVSAPALAFSATVRGLVGIGSSSVPHDVFVTGTRTDEVVFGMTRGQVLRRIGPPARKVGPCWLYREHVKIGKAEDGTLSTDSVCFLGGRYAYRYIEIDARGAPSDEAPVSIRTFRP